MVLLIEGENAVIKMFGEFWRIVSILIGLIILLAFTIAFVAFSISPDFSSGSLAVLLIIFLLLIFLMAGPLAIGPFFDVTIFFDKNSKEWIIKRPRFIVNLPISYEEIRVKKKLKEIKVRPIALINLKKISGFLILVFEDGTEIQTVPNYFGLQPFPDMMNPYEVDKDGLNSFAEKFNVTANW